MHGLLHRTSLPVFSLGTMHFCDLQSACASERYGRINSSYRGVYITIARWCNQPSFFKKKTLREYAQMPGNATALRYISDFKRLFPEAGRYFNLRF